MTSKPVKVLLWAILTALPALALAQWQWVDKDGRKVFSDHPPPPDVAEKNILRQPGGVTKPGYTAGVSSVTSDGSSPAPAAGASAAAGDSKKKPADEAETARRKALAQNCERAKNNLTVLNSGVRLRVPNGNGETDYLTDAERAAEVERVRAIVQSDCNAQ